MARIIPKTDEAAQAPHQILNPVDRRRFGTAQVLHTHVAAEPPPWWRGTRPKPTMPMTRRSIGRIVGARLGITRMKLVVILLLFPVLAALLVTQVHRAWLETHEHFALVSLRKIGKACELYSMVNNAYPRSLKQLSLPFADPPFLDASLAGDGRRLVKRGYTFTYAKPNPDEQWRRETFRVVAHPVRPGLTGDRHFAITETLKIYSTVEDRAPTAHDVLVEQVRQ